MNRSHTYRWVSIIMVLIGASSYGLLAPFVKLAYRDGFNELQVSAAQMMLGTVILWVIVLIRPKMWSNPFKGPWIRLSVVGIFGLALTTFFYNIALSRLEASLAIVLLFQFTWMTIAIESVITKKRPTRFQLVAAGVIMVGTLLTVGLSVDMFSLLNPVGLIFGLLAGFTYSLFLFLIGRIKTTMNSIMKSVIMLTAAFPIFFMIYTPQDVLEGNTFDFILWGTILGLLGQVIPTIFFNYGIPRIGSSLAAVLGAVELPVAVVAALFILGELVNGLQWAGILLILAGIFIAEMKTR